MSTKDNTRDSNATVGRKSLTGVLDGNPEDAEMLGQCVMTTTGDHLYVERDWLEEQFDKFGLPEVLMPRKVRPWMAYGRATNELVDTTNDETITNVGGHSLETQFRLEDGDDKHYHLYADIFYPEKLVGEEGGDHDTQKIGTFNYLRDTEKVISEPHIDEGHPLWSHWKDFDGRLRALFKRHQLCNNGNDMRDIIETFLFVNDNPDVPKVHTVRFRNGTYFVGAHHSDTVEALSAIWNDMNQFKKRGQRCKIDTIPVIDSEKQRQQVRRLAEEKLDSIVDSALSDAFTQLQEGETPKEIASRVVDQIGEGTDLAAEYNALLDAELEVERFLESRREDFEDEKEEIIEEAMSKLQQ